MHTCAGEAIRYLSPSYNIGYIASDILKISPLLKILSVLSLFYCQFLAFIAYSLGFYTECKSVIMSDIDAAPAAPVGIQQRIGQQMMSATAAMAELQRQAKKGAKWVTHFTAGYIPSEPNGPVYLICKACSLHLSASNASDTMKHIQLMRCKGPGAKHAAQASAVSAAPTASGSGRSAMSAGPSQHQPGIKGYIPSTGQIQIAKEELAMYFYTSETPFGRVENEHLRKAFAILGVSLMGATTLRTTMLSAAKAKVQDVVEAKMVRMHAGLQQLSTQQ